MEDLINNMNNLEIKEERETFSINKRMKYFCIKGKYVYRFSYSQNKWIFGCFTTFFPEYKRSIIIDLPDIKILRKYEKRRYNKGVLERSKDGKVWRCVCIFIDNNGQCYNLSIISCGSFCKNHKTGVINEKINVTQKGDIIEEWVFDQLCKSDQLINVKNVGRDNGKLDIIFQVKDEVNKGNNQFRGIQVKHLKINGKNGYCIRDLKKYNKDTLIVGVSEDKKYMCLIFNNLIGDLDSFCFNINTYKKKDNLKPYIFAGLDDNSLEYTFFNKLIEYCKISIICDNSQFSEDILKENEMMKELNKKCEENNLSFKPHTSSDSPIDVYINKKRVQCKYSSQIDKNLYYFGLNHTIDNKINQPYSENDVDLFIFKHQYEDSFYIIPQNVLIYFGYLTTENVKGKLGLNIAPSSYKEYHWTKQFINRFDLINNEYNLDKLINLNNPFDKFQHKCKLNNIKCTRNMTNLSVTNGFIGDKTFKLMTSKIENSNTYTFHILKNNPYHINDLNVPDFFVFRIEFFPEDFYIIPKNILVEHEIIGYGDKKGKKQLGLPEPTDKTNQKQWVFDYLNNFDLLKNKINLPEEI